MEKNKKIKNKMKKPITVKGKRWIPSIQDWSWIITIVWMVIANIWKPFGLFGFVCMFTPIIIALTGRGKMHCARVCPRGSLLGFAGRFLSRRREAPKLFYKKWFRPAVWGVMMGSFLIVLIITIPKGVYVLGNAILIFMETATAIALVIGVLFKPRTWCTICPMGFSTGNIRKLRERKRK
ncbi:MAG: 4Fe-4S binding protein [Ruminococcus sp.]